MSSCLHNKPVELRWTMACGRKMYVQQCMKCGRPVGGFRTEEQLPEYVDVSKVKEWDRELRQRGHKEES